MKTAEWLCARCGATNRILVREEVRQTTDRCVTCRTRHALEEDERPVRWRAEPS